MNEFKNKERDANNDERGRAVKEDGRTTNSEATVPTKVRGPTHND